jgi:hypothetical protein
MDGVPPASRDLGLLKLIRKEGKYYECIAYNLDR